MIPMFLGTSTTLGRDAEIDAGCVKFIDAAGDGVVGAHEAAMVHQRCTIERAGRNVGDQVLHVAKRLSVDNQTSA